MVYRFVKNLAIADVMFEAEATDINSLFADCAKALSNTMVKNLSEIKHSASKNFSVSSNGLDTLLIDFLDRLIFYKDTEQLIFGSVTSDIKKVNDKWIGSFKAEGEKINPERHELLVDVKAATMHMLSVKKSGDKWEAKVVLDI